MSELQSAGYRCVQMRKYLQTYLSRVQGRTDSPTAVIRTRSVPLHKKAYRSRGIAPVILNLGPRWRGLVNFTPRPLYPLVSFKYDAGRVLQSVCMTWRPDKTTTPAQTRTPYRPAHSMGTLPTAILTSDASCAFLGHDNLSRGTQFFQNL